MEALNTEAAATSVKIGTTWQRKIQEPPTVTQEGLMLLCIIYTMENRNIATTDIYGALLQTEMEGMVRLWLEIVLHRNDPEDQHWKV